MPAVLRCGNKYWGARHITRRGHFGGGNDLSAWAVDLIFQTLNFPDEVHSERNFDSKGKHIGSSTVYNARLTCTLTSPIGHGPMPTKTPLFVDVRVIVNPKSNNIISAYIIDVQIDSHPEWLPPGCGPE